MQKITIKNFGPITEIIDLEIKDLMVFIGPQATGKSTVAKLVYFFQSLRSEFIYSIDEIAKNKQAFTELHFAFKERIRRKFNSLFSPSNMYLNTNFEIGCFYTNENYISVCNYDRISFKIIDNEKYADIFWAIRKGSLEYDDKRYEILVDLLAQYFPESKDQNGYRDFLRFIPAGRTRFTQKVNNRGNASQEYYLLDAFDELFSQSDYIPSHKVSEINIHFVDIAQKILHAKWKLDGHVHLNRPNTHLLIQDQNIPLQYASSGQQEVIILLEAIEYVLYTQRNHYFVVEEPESHLYPIAQKWIVEALALYFNQRYDNQLLLTTHSPYILTSLDNLITAAETAKMGERHKEAVKKVIPEELWIDFDRVGAYYMENGTIRDIKNYERRGIGANEIDNASEEIASVFDQLLAIKYDETTEPA